jgi:hypothetical protein
MEAETEKKDWGTTKALIGWDAMVESGLRRWGCRAVGGLLGKGKRSREEQFDLKKRRISSG